MSEGDPGNESFEERLRALARELGESVERAAEQIDLDEVAERIGISGERVRQLADLASQWLNQRFEGTGPVTGWPFGAGGPAAGQPPAGAKDATGTPADAPPRAAEPRKRAAGPHPLDMPTEEQGLALSALDSGRWRVQPGSNAISSAAEGPPPVDDEGLVGELRARDWIAASGEVTLVGRDALRRWMEAT